RETPMATRAAVSAAPPPLRPATRRLSSFSLSTGRRRRRTTEEYPLLKPPTARRTPSAFRSRSRTSVSSTRSTVSAWAISRTSRPGSSPESSRAAATSPTSAGWWSRLRAASRRRGQGHPETGVDGDLLPGDQERELQLVDDPGGHPLGGAAVGGLEEEGELVAPETGHRVLRADAALEAFGHLHQQAVAGRVAQRVVDRLEVVEVEEEDGERRRLP